MSQNLKKALQGLVSKSTKGDVDYGSIASMRLGDLKQYGIKIDDAIAVIARETKRSFTDDEKRSLPLMSIDAIVNMEAQQQQNAKLEAANEADQKKRKAASDALKDGKAA